MRKLSIYLVEPGLSSAWRVVERATTERGIQGGEPEMAIGVRQFDEARRICRNMKNLPPPMTHDEKNVHFAVRIALELSIEAERRNDFVDAADWQEKAAQEVADTKRRWRILLRAAGNKQKGNGLILC